MIKTVTDPNNRKCKIEISDDMIWCIPFLSKAKILGIPIWRIERIKSHNVPLSKEEQVKAHIHKNTDNHKFEISVVLYSHVKIKTGKYTYKKVGYVDLFENHFEEVLNSLAHELSHCVEWEHTADRFILESKLMLSFSKLAKKIGYQGY